MLRRLAAETAGVDLMLGYTVDGLIERDGRVAGVRAAAAARRRRPSGAGDRQAPAEQAPS